MKKHLLLILALLAFVLPARAQSEPDMLYNFKNNSTASTYGTTFGTSVDIDNVIANVTGVDVTDYGANAKNYVSAITEATNVAYNSKGGVYMKAGGKLTFTLKKGYKVTGYQFMGQQVDGTTATITLNGIIFDGPTETQASGQYSRLYHVPSEVKTVNSITISSNKNVYIKSVGIYIEAEASDLTVNVAPPAGTYNVGQVVMASANNTSANVQMIISKIEGDNYTEISKTTTTGYNSYTFSEVGKYQVIAQAYTGNWQTTSNYFCEEYTIVGTSTPATLSVNPAGGTYSAPQTISISSSKADDEIYVTLTDQNNNSLVDDTFTGSWTYILSNPGTYTLYALNNDNSEINETYTITGDTPTPATLSVNPAGGTYHYPQTVTITSSKSDDEFSVLLKNQNVTLVYNNFTGSWTYTFPGLGTYTLYAFNSDNSEINETYIITGDPCPIEITPAGTNITTGTEIKVASSVSDATLKIMVTKDGETFVEENFFNNPYTFTPTEPGTYVVEAVASATGYTDNSKNATYTVTAPVRNEVAPVITFSHEDQKVFGSEEEIDVTLTLNHDVYPVPEVIYYTLDGFMAHNTLETGNPGATPAGHVLTVAVDPSTLSGTVRIERFHREALNHRAVTINAYTFNTAGSDVAAATYIFNDNGSAPQPQPETVATPVFAPASGASAEGSLDVTVTCATEGATITVTGAGEARTGNSPLTFTLTPGEYNLSATAAKEGMTTSEAVTASFTVTQTQAQDSDHKADFNTFNHGVAYGSYATYNSTDGWSAINSCVLSGTNNTSDNNPYFQFLGTPEDFAICLNGKKSSAGKLTSPKFNGNIKSLKFNYGFPYSESKCKFTVNIIDGTNKVVKSEAVEITSLTQKQAYSKEITGIDYTGEFTIEIVNNCLSASTSNKDRVAIWNLTWFGNGEIVTDANAATVAVEVAPKAAASTTTTVKPSDLTAMQANKDFTTGNFKFKFTAIASKTTSDVTVNQDAIWTISTVDGSKITAISIPWSGKSGSRTIVHTPASTNASDGTLSGTSGNINWAGSATSVQTKFKQGKQLKLSSFIITTEAADPTVDTPEIALNDRAGDTTKPVTATISCSTDGADIHYSVKKDGVETVADEVYSAALTFTEAGSYELTAWATKDGMTASAKATEPFTITLPVCEAPAFEPLTGAEAFNSLTVKLSCATEGAQIQYKVNNGEQKVYDANTGIVLEGVGVYTITAWATKEGMTKSAEVTATYTVKAEPVEELFFVMDQNLWDVDGAYPETVVPFVYDRENGWYDLDIASIPATGWRQTAEGWFEINGGFRGNFYVRDGKANRKGLVFGAAGTVANTTYATRAAADGNQLVEPGVEYNMYIAGESDTHKVFTTIGDDTNSKAFSAGTIRVTHTPGNKDAAKPMTLQILANSDQTTGVDSITAEDAANDADARFFNLQGVEVPADRLAPGIYIRQAGSKATKVLVK